MKIELVLNQIGPYSLMDMEIILNLSRSVSKSIHITH